MVRGRVRGAGRKGQVPGRGDWTQRRVRMTALGVLSRRVPPLISRRTTTSLDPFDLSRPDHRASGDSARPIDRVDAAGAARRDRQAHCARETPRSGPLMSQKPGERPPWEAASPITV